MDNLKAALLSEDNRYWLQLAHVKAVLVGVDQYIFDNIDENGVGVNTDHVEHRAICSINLNSSHVPAATRHDLPNYAASNMPHVLQYELLLLG